VDVTVVDPSAPRPTLAEVARVAGVSSATVSRVINGFAKVRPETRRQVEDAIVNLGYVRHRATHRNDRLRTGSIAFVVCEETLRLFSDPFFGLVFGGASRVLAPSGSQIILLIAQSARDARSLMACLNPDHVDGALVVSLHARDVLALDLIDVPMVSIGRPVCDDPQRYTYVDVDNQGGAEAAVRHLIRSGRTRIATIAGPKDMAPSIDRLAGYREVLTGEGRFDPALVAHGDFGQVSGEHVTLRLLDRRPDIDAIFVASDLMAIGALRALHRTNRKVPDDVAIIGFDDSPLARTAAPSLTTVSQPVEPIGAHAARELLALIAGNAAPPRHTVLRTRLVIRESA
jgi:DNA-binding LacI/PurR family transcriptional regulator